MELNEDIEMLEKIDPIKIIHQNNLIHKKRSNILKKKRKRNQKDNDDHFEYSPYNNLFYDYSENLNYDNDIFCEYDHSIKSLSTNEESCSMKNENKNTMICQLKKDLCPNYH